jgi:hypothetical protein
MHWDCSAERDLASAPIRREKVETKKAAAKNSQEEVSRRTIVAEQALLMGRWKEGETNCVQAI